MTKYDNIIISSLIACVITFFLWGLGYLVTTDADRTMELKKQCIESGMQYIGGNCVK